MKEIKEKDIMAGKAGWEYLATNPFNGNKLYTDGKTIVNQFGKTCVWFVD